MREAGLTPEEVADLWTVDGARAAHERVRSRSRARKWDGEWDGDGTSEASSDGQKKSEVSESEWACTCWRVFTGCSVGRDREP